MSGIAPNQNTFKIRIAPDKQNSIVKNKLAGRWVLLANGTLCFNTPKHNGKSGTIHTNDDGYIVNDCQQYFAFTFVKLI
jgi:hypothetical protein